MSLPGPYEFWDQADGEVRRVQIVKWSEGTVTIEPKTPDAKGPKVIQAIRLYLTPESKPTIPPYWDITSKHLVAHLRGILLQTDFRGRTYEITKLGTPPSARYTVTVIPG